MFRVWPWCKFAGWGICAFWRLTSTIVLKWVHHEKHKCTTREKGTVTMMKPWKQGDPCQNYKVLFGDVFPVLSMAASRNIFQSFELVTSIYTSRVSKKPQSLCPKCQENPRNQWNPWDMAAVTLHLPQSPCLRLVRPGSPGKAQTLKVGNWDQHGIAWPSNWPSATLFCRCASTTLWHCVFFLRLPLSNHLETVGPNTGIYTCQQGTDLLIMSSFRMPSAHCEKAVLPRINKAEGKAKELEDLSSFRISSLGCSNLVIWVTEGKRISERGKGLLRDLVQVCDIGPYGYRFWYDCDKITCEGSWCSGTGWAPRIFRRYMPSVRGRLVISNKSYCKVVRNKLLNPQSYHPQCTKLS